MSHDRRHFMLRLGSLLVLLPAARVIAACGGYTAPTSSSSTELTFTSSMVNNHAHTVQISTQDLAAPPAAGKSLTTSLAASHTHVVELTEADLTAIESGQTIMKTTNVNMGHAHAFTFVKTAGTQTNPTPTPAPTHTGY